MGILYKSSICIIVCFVCSSFHVKDYFEKEYNNYSYQEFFQLEQSLTSIDVENIDYELLDAAIFHATNEIRHVHQLPLFYYSPILYQSSKSYTRDMVNYDFFSHTHPIKMNKRMLKNRIEDKDFRFAAENIAIAHIYKMNYEYKYQIKRNKDNPSTMRWSYYDEEGKRKLKCYAYKTFGRRIVRQWMQSREHRLSILNRNYTHFACSAYFEYNYLGTPTIPMIRATQHFGGN